MNYNSFSYTYSYSFLEYVLVSKTSNSEFLALAPINYTDLDLVPLYYSEDEVNWIKEYFSGIILINDLATKENFKRYLSDYGILHLATHADAQDSLSPWIAFYDKKISLGELYLLENNASLVILSGCNTSLGDHANGEGVMSLARGFFFGGAQSVIASLWSINDRATQVLIKEFYRSLGKGKHKSDALRKSKLKYIESHTLSEVSPYYWASLILIGRDDNIESSTNNQLLLLSFVAIVIGIFLLFRTVRASIKSA